MILRKNKIISGTSLNCKYVHAELLVAGNCSMYIEQICVHNIPPII